MQPSRHEIAVVALLVVGALVATVGHSQATMRGDVEVLGSTCTDGGIAAVHLQVSVNETMTVHPHTWDEKRHVQHPWTPRNLTLEPGIQRVTIVAPSERARITSGQRAQVALNDGQRRLIANWEARACQ
jgi:hypothetical protein